MKLLLTVAVVLAACAEPAFAQADRSIEGCWQEPETTGALPADPRSLYLPGERMAKAESDPLEESWQAQARESFEQRRQDLLECGVD